MSERARLFVAVDLPPAPRAALAGWRAAHPRGLRPVPPDALHVTLAFLGWRPAAHAEAIGALLEPLASPVAGLALGPAVWLPRRRPRVLAVRLEDPTGALAALQAGVAAALADRAGFVPERRAFLPHVTAARVPSGVRPPREPPAAPRAAPFAAQALTLYRSHLSRAGARYEALGRTPLGRRALPS